MGSDVPPEATMPFSTEELFWIIAISFIVVVGVLLFQDWVRKR